MTSPGSTAPPRLRLEFVRPSHAEAIQKIVGHWKLAEYTRLPHPYPGDGAITFVRESIEGRIRGLEYIFAVMEHGVLRGICGIQDIDRAAMTGDLGYWVDQAHWGKGIATASAWGVCSFAMQVVGLSKITASHASRNAASGRVMQKLGFRAVLTQDDSRLGQVLCYELGPADLLEPQEIVEMDKAAVRKS